jgi:hypothetical protein
VRRKRDKTNSEEQYATNAMKMKDDAHKTWRRCRYAVMENTE